MDSQDLQEFAKMQQLTQDFQVSQKPLVSEVITSLEQALARIRCKDPNHPYVAKITQWLESNQQFK